MNRKHIIDSLFMVLLFGLFVSVCIMTVASGAGAYKRNIRINDDNYNKRTSLFYIVEKIHSFEIDGAINLCVVEDRLCLRLDERIENQVYSTWIFSSEGNIREVTLEEGILPKATDGQEIISGSTVEFKKEAKLIVISVVSSGGDREATVKVCPKTDWRSER